MVGRGKSSGRSRGARASLQDLTPFPFPAVDLCPDSAVLAVHEVVVAAASGSATLRRLPSTSYVARWLIAKVVIIEVYTRIDVSKFTYRNSINANCRPLIHINVDNAG